MLPRSLRTPSDRSIADMESERAMLGLTIKDLGDLCGPFSRSSYWRWLQGEARVVVAVEVGLARVRDAYRAARDEIIDKLGSADPKRVVHIVRWRDEDRREKANTSTGARLSFSAYGTFIGWLVDDLRAAGHTVEVSFHEEREKQIVNAENGPAFAPDPDIPEADFPVSAQKQQRRRHYG